MMLGCSGQIPEPLKCKRVVLIKDLCHLFLPLKGNDQIEIPTTVVHKTLCLTRIEVMPLLEKKKICIKLPKEENELSDTVLNLLIYYIWSLSSL